MRPTAETLANLLIKSAQGELSLEEKMTLDTWHPGWKTDPQVQYILRNPRSVAREKKRFERSIAPKLWAGITAHFPHIFPQKRSKDFVRTLFKVFHG